MTPEEELATLIEEQRRDDRPLQRPEPFTTHFAPAGETNEDIFDAVATDRLKEKSRGCILHGYKYEYVDSRGEFRCRECRRIYEKRYRKEHPLKPEVVARRTKRARERYAEDPDFRERRKLHAKRWREKVARRVRDEEEENP